MDFRNTVVVMTSNLGSQFIQEMAGEENYEAMRTAVMDSVATRSGSADGVDEPAALHQVE